MIGNLMSRRSYDQYCGLAHALDLVGERWTPLVVRDLALDPRRFTDLLEGLPGIGPSVLSELFRAREATGVHDCYEFRVKSENVWVVIDDGTIAVSTDKPREPDFVLTLDVPTLAALGAGHMTPEQAVESGAARFEGDPAAGWRALRMLGSEGYAQRA